MRKIGIMGFGLIGGSLAKVLKKRNLVDQIVASSRSESSLLKSLDDKVIDNYSLDIDNIFEDCDIIFICTPVSQIGNYVRKLIPIVSNNCIITDVGSTKGNLYKEMEQFGDSISFIGGHPMAGSEKTGYDAAKDYLFENAYYIITPLPSVCEDKIKSFIDLIKAIGAIPIQLSPFYHDFAVSAISHVPHIIATTLVNMVRSLDSGSDSHLSLLAAGGFKDVTRIASSSPEMWHSICFDNKEEILKVLSGFKNNLLWFESALSAHNEGEVMDYFIAAKNYRDNFSNLNRGGYNSAHIILVDVEDKPGIIATVATMLSVNNINIKNIGIVNNREYENGILQIILEEKNSMLKSIKLLEKMNFTVYTKN